MSTVEAEIISKDFIRYLEMAAKGETIVIAKHATPIAELRPTSETATGIRPFGLCAGEFFVPDDFNEPLPASLEVVSKFDFTKF